MDKFDIWAKDINGMWHLRRRINRGWRVDIVRPKFCRTYTIDTGWRLDTPPPDSLLCPTCKQKFVEKILRAPV